MVVYGGAMMVVVGDDLGFFFLFGFWDILF